MENAYGLSNEQTMDEQNSDIPINTSSNANVKKSKTVLSYQSDDSDIGTSTSRSYLNFKNSLIGSGEGDGEYSSEETIGEAPITTGGTESAEESAEFSEEISNPNQESGEEYYEAAPDKLTENYSEESNEEGLFDVIGSVVGGLLGGESEEIREAGTAIEGGFENGQEVGSQEEIFPFLAALVPTLISSIGPAVAKGVMSKLSPRARVGVKKIAASAPKVVAGKVIPRAGKNILSVFAKFLEAANEKPMNESGEELGEELTSLITEAAAAMEVIIGKDDRKRITNTTNDPWQRICALRITFPSGKTYRGTGFFIGARTVATAGHCVYLHNQGGWARKVEVIPGANDSTKPYGSSESMTFRSVKGWVNSKKPEHDYGCIVLPAGAFGEKKLGKFGYASPSGETLLTKSAILFGYPGDKPFAQLWGMRRKIKTVTGKTLIYELDTVGGQSGAPVYIKLNGKRYVIGIHNYGNSSGNSATRITPAVFNNLKKWSSIS
ncbi:MAG: serine protease [Nitrosomonas sp.]|uniref:trypsin-like serine peptidase n=1 Tax=Nitrosomonas sp. JL21 TaxID=153949 RepID=UPI00136840A1|nr:serine protease [Nitrosomonas sp. JL21]MBL8498128.1 serine protease [Nitrosomonas sp.]MCC7090705.1 serine protease [Nitrosomonas sp.]